MRKVLITTGGTGGHIYPALSLAKKLKDKGVELFFVGTNSRMEKDIVPENGYKFYGLPINPLRKIDGIWSIIKSTFLAIKLIKDEKPDAIIGFGNYISVPALLAGFYNKKKVYIHEQNIELGLANRFFCRFVDKMFLSFDETFNTLPVKYQGKLFVTGNPVREDFYKVDREKVRESLKLADDEKMLLIIGGSLGAKIINEKILENWNRFYKEKKLRVYWATGRDKFEEINKNIFKMKKDDVIRPYFENMAEIMSASDLILCRAGASTVSEIIETNKPSIFIPYNYVGQEKNARALEGIGGSLIYSEDRLNEAINEIFSLLRDEEKLHRMSRCLKKLRKGDSALKIAEEIDIWRK